MGVLNRLSFRAKLILLLAFPVLGLVAFGLFSINLTNELQVNGPLYVEIVQGKDLVADILPPPEYIVESYLTSYQLVNTTDPGEISKLRKRLLQLEEEYGERHKFWVESLEDGPMKKALVEQSYQPAREFFQVATREVVPAVERGDFETARQLLSSKLAPAFEEHRAAIDQTVSYSNASNAKHEAEATERIKDGMITLLSIGGLTIALSLMFGLFISGNLVRPLRNLTAVARGVAGGDVDLTVEVNSKDETGVLADAFRSLIDYLKEMAAAAGAIAANDLTTKVEPRSERDALGNAFLTMITNLSGMIGKLTDDSSKLVSTATEISASASQISQGSREQADQVKQVSTAVEEMSATIVETSRHSGEAASAAKAAADTAINGGEIVSNTIQGMQRIAQVVKESAESINQLAASADKIGEIISVIDDIADQTNLLALNAAIEAARAGEQGRGFAMVADEVRKLAERTGKATGEITQMIKGIQTETGGAVASMQSGLQEVEQGRELADRAGNSLNEIVATVQSVSSMIAQIATASEEQSAAAEEISKNLDHISSVTSESALGATQSATAAEELNNQAETLQKMVSRFRVTK